MSNLQAITSFLPLSDDIATAGQPRAEQFADIGAAGYDLVVNLAMETSTAFLANERELVEEAGMRYIALPVEWEAPSKADFQQFAEILEANKSSKVFVHCALNMRVSAFMYLYRILHEGVEEYDAARDLHRIWVPNAVWASFIESILPKPC